MEISFGFRCLTNSIPVYPFNFCFYLRTGKKRAKGEGEKDIYLMFLSSLRLRLEKVPRMPKIYNC